jgi:Helix-turn-helix domain
MGFRRPNPRLVKLHRNYSVEDIARLFGIHKNTVRSWLKQDLAAIDDRRPTLILGRELLRFLQERRQRAKQSCGPGRIYCIACRAPKRPAGKMAECIPTGPHAGNLRGICPDCDRLIYRRVNLAKIDAVRGELEITFTQPRARLGESAVLSVNCDSGEKAKADENA